MRKALITMECYWCLGNPFWVFCLWNLGRPTRRSLEWKLSNQFPISATWSNANFFLWYLGQYVLLAAMYENVCDSVSLPEHGLVKFLLLKGYFSTILIYVPWLIMSWWCLVYFVHWCFLFAVDLLLYFPCAFSFFFLFSFSGILKPSSSGLSSYFSQSCKSLIIFNNIFFVGCVFLAWF